MRRAYRDLEHDSRTLEICVAAQHYSEDLHRLNTFDAHDGSRRNKFCSSADNHLFRLAGIES